MSTSFDRSKRSERSKRSDGPPHCADVAFVMATYNRMHMLPKAIFSLTNQTLPAKQILVLDDASTDGTWDYLQTVCKIHANLRIFRNDINSGGVHGRLLNQLIEHCTATWYMPHSDDDTKRSHCIETLYAVTHDQDVVYGDSKLHGVHHHRSENWDPELLNQRNYIDIGEAMVRVSTWREIGQYDESLIGAVDWEFWLRLARAPHRYRVLHLPHIITDYYFHPQMMTRRPDHQHAIAAIKEKYQL